MERASKRVFITGIEGFTGRALESYLLQNAYSVCGSSLDGKNTTYQMDITNIDSVRDVLNDYKPDYIIHLAAISFVAHSDNEAFYRVNTIGSENILKVAKEISVKKLILASSAAVYGRREEAVLNESLCPTPSNHYGNSKYAMERVASNYFDESNIIITRPFNYTGIGQSDNFLIPKIVKHYAEGKRVIELGNIDVIREFNDIDFVCSVYEKLINCNCNSVTVNICSGRGVALIEIIKIMNNIAGYEIEVKTNPKFVRKDEIKKVVGSAEKLKSLIGNFKLKALEDMLKEMYEYYRKYQ